MNEFFNHSEGIVVLSSVSKSIPLVIVIRISFGAFKVGNLEETRLLVYQGKALNVPTVP